MPTLARRLAQLGVVVLTVCGIASAQITARASVSSTGAQANRDCLAPAISADGRYVAFESAARHLVPNNYAPATNVYVHDRITGTTECMSLTPGGATGDADSTQASISADGRFVAFSSLSPYLVSLDLNHCADVFVRDRQTGHTERVSVASTGAEGDGASTDPSISADGRFVVFSSLAGNLIPGGMGAGQLYLRDRLLGTTEMVSYTYGGSPVFGVPGHPKISADGRFVAFDTDADDVVPNDTNGRLDVFVRDLQTGTNERVSVDSSGAQASNSSYLGGISADGRFVAFQSLASDLVPGDTNGSADVFLRDRLAGTTERSSVAFDGAQADGLSYQPTVSPDGRYVLFVSVSSNLVPDDSTPHGGWFFIRDRQLATTELGSRSSGGARGDSVSERPCASADGRFVAFQSGSDNLVPFDTNNLRDVFVRDTLSGSAVPAFASLCSPGIAGVIACPCSNPPSGPDRGCDNSAATGGATLAADGSTALTTDGLSFTTTGELPDALSVLVQSKLVVAGGVVYGQGVRCLGGALRRLYTKTASAGAIRAPDLPGGDDPVSVRSFVKGDAILGGESRWYAVYYRDATVLGGCPATSTFTATQAGQVAWSY